MKRAGRGAIVNISSGAGRSYSLTGIQAYASAKAGLIGFTRQTARELGAHGIRVNCIAPGIHPLQPGHGGAVARDGRGRPGAPRRVDRAAPPRHARGHRPRRRLLRLRRRGVDHRPDHQRRRRPLDARLATTTGCQGVPMQVVGKAQPSAPGTVTPLALLPVALQVAGRHQELAVAVVELGGSCRRRRCPSARGRSRRRRRECHSGCSP